MMHELDTTNYAGDHGTVPATSRDRLQALLEQHEPHQPLALAAYLNGTPTLAALDQLTPGEVQAMLDRLLGNPTYTLAAWIKHLQLQAVSAELAGAGWLR